MANITQGTTEWHQLRLGKVTASRIADVVGKGKKGEYFIAREHYKKELATERITGEKIQIEPNQHMLRGIELEPAARRNYELNMGCSVTEIAFVDHPTIKMSGASPDGLVGADGLIEIKCPTETVHLATIITDEIHKRYVYQMQWQLACTQRKWCDFVSFNLDVPDINMLYISRVFRDSATIQFLELEVAKFLEEVEVLYNEMKGNI